MDVFDIVLGQYYRNKKNKQKYVLVDMATHSETLEPMIVYQALYGDNKIWVRPLDLFLEKFELWET